MSLFRPFAVFLAAGLRPAFAGFLGAAVAVGCEVAIAFGLTLKYSVLPKPFAPPRSQATHQVISCTKYTIEHAVVYGPKETRATNAFQYALYLHGRLLANQTCDLSPQLHQLLQSRSPLGLEAIDDVALMDRFDSKYVVPVAWLEDLVHGLNEHSVLSIQDQVSTVYNNLYFDTPDGTCLDDHTRGKTVRHKVRVRQYANTGMAFLEVKLRDVHGKTYKHRIVRNGAWDDSLTQEELDFLNQHLPNAHALVPTLQSSFERFTLIHVSHGERITFDQDLQFKVPAAKESGTHPWVKPTPHLTVVEWKQSKVNHQGELIQAIRAQKGRRGPLGRALRLSKFVLGQAHLAPERNFRGYRAALRDLRAQNITLQTRPSRRNPF